MMTHTLVTRARVLVLLAAALLGGPVPALGQVREPPGPVAVDARVARPRFKENVSVASALGVDSATLPGRGLGLVFGAHWYPLRARAVTLGLGGEVLVSRGSRAPDVDDEAEPPPAAGPDVSTRFSSVSPQLSLNFGSNRGWSYLTGGLGWGAFRTERADMPVTPAESRPRVVNYGGGARWFAKEHVAFALDLRFYAIAAQEAAQGRPAYPSQTLMVFSAGVAFK